MMKSLFLYIGVCILDLMYLVSGQYAHFQKLKRYSVCATSYGSAIAARKGVPSSSWCASLCIERTNCGSFVYNETGRLCSLHTNMLINPSNSDDCVSQVIYGEKRLCIEGNSCTYPQQDMRLCDGAYPGQCDQSKGRLEVFLSGQWGTVCDDHWGSNPNAVVLCRMFGYTNGDYTGSAFYGKGTGPIHLDDIICAGNESSIFSCPLHGGHICTHDEDVGVTCY